MQPHAHSLPPVLAAYGLESARLEPVTMGNINTTLRVSAGTGRYVLQRLNPIFGAEVHLDIEAVTAHLAAAGMATPRLVPTRDGALWTRDPDGGVWRLLTLVEGVVHSEAATPALCASAGRLLGRFHGALADLEHDFRSRRPDVHDTARHLAHLEHVLATHRRHPAHAEVEPLGRAILEAAGELRSFGELPARVVHGDPKLNNIVFSPAGEAVCLIDLDTLARMSIPLELGDALRSWCNPLGEDCAETRFDLELFAAAIGGYAATAGSTLTRVEVAGIVTAVELVALELATRFAADALTESYFGWDRSRFAAAWEHNLLRARGQASLARSIATQRRAMQEAVAAALGAEARRRR